MLKNYLLVALRSLRRRPGTTAINVVGLAVGMAACLSAYAFVAHETSFDDYHEAAERTYRVNTFFEDFIGGEPSLQSESPEGLAQELRRGVPGVERAGLLQQVFGTSSVKAGEAFFEEERAGYVDRGFFEVFDYEPLAGGTDRLAEPGTAVLTARTARRYFGDPAEAMGRSFRLGEERTFEVVGVVADPPTRTHLPFQLFLSYATLARNPGWFNYWGFSDGHTAYVVLDEGTDPARVEARLNALRQSHQDAEARANTRFELQPMRTIHTDPISERYGGSYETAPAYLWGVSLVAVIIALLAIVNFVNLTTAHASRRAREIGVRQAVGAQRGQLVAQFMGEAALLTLGAALLGWLAAYELLPLFGRLFDLELARATLLRPQALAFAGGATVVTALLAGLYPALVLSGTRPADVLKGASAGGRVLRGARLRRGLTLFQLTAAQILLIGTLVAGWQLDYVQTKDLGFESDARLTVPVPRDSTARVRFREALRAQPAVRGVTYTMGGPTRRGLLQKDLPAPTAPGDTLRAVRLVPLDAGYLSVYGLRLLAGRSLTEEDEQGPSGRVALVNRAMAERLGFEQPANVLGTVLTDDDDFEVEVVGVTEDFHHSSLRSEVKPVLMFYWPRWTGYAGVALDPNRVAGGVAETEVAFTSVFPDTHFRYEFLSEYLRSLYQNERRVARAVWVFTGLAIFIACLGLFGLAAFTAERRTKEIGIRKTLGASVTHLIALLSTDFLRLVLVAFVVAAPLAWLAMDRWLEDFAYRVDLGVGVFALAGALAVAVAVVAVGTHALRAASADPVKSLRYE